MSIEEMIKWIDEYRKTVIDEEVNTRLSLIGIFLVRLKELCNKERQEVRA